MSSSTLRPMASTSHLSHPRPQDVVRVAPYLTHVVTHHGQLTLIPPQNAGRIRKPKKKPTDTPHARSERRLPDDEPRFTTAVPASSSRRLYPAPVQPHPRPRKQAAAPVNARAHEAIAFPDEPPIPDYPPPSFQEAVGSPEPYDPSDAPNSPISPSALSVQATLAPTVSSPTSVTSSQDYPSPTIPSQSRHVLPFDTAPDTDADADASDSDDLSVELVALEPAEQWEADREMGVPLVERVARERQRLESSLSSNYSSFPNAGASTSQIMLHSRSRTEPSPTRRCSHCGSLRPIDCHSDTGADDRDEPERETVSEPCPSPVPSPRMSAEQSQQNLGVQRAAFVRRLAPHFLKRENGTGGGNTSSAPSSPLASSPTIVTTPSPWASSLTLSHANPATTATPNTGTAANGAATTPAHKNGPFGLVLRRDALGVRKLFGSRSRDKTPQEAVPQVRVFPSEELGDWEVVDALVTDAEATSASQRGRARPAALAKPKKDRYTMTPQAFIERPVRRPGAANSPTSPNSTATTRALSSGASPVLARGPPLRPEKSSPRARREHPVILVDDSFPDHPVPRSLVNTSLGAGTTPMLGSASPVRTSPTRASPNIVWRPMGADSVPRDVRVSPVVPAPAPVSAAPVMTPAPQHDTAPSVDTSQHQTSDQANRANVAGNESPSLSPTELHRQAAIRSRRSADKERAHSPEGGPLSVTIVPSSRGAFTDANAPLTSGINRPGAASPTSPTSPASPVSPASPTSPASPASPMTPTTPTTPGGHHYPGRPLPRPPSESSSPTTPTQVKTPPVVVPLVEESEDAQEPSGSGSGVEMSESGTEAGDYALDTDLAAFAASIPENGGDGATYEDLLRLADVLGPAHTSSPASRPGPEKTVPLVGHVELLRRRLADDGTMRIKLKLLGATVDKCGICLSQFKDREIGALGASCMHAFHERCLRRWLATSHQCPMCRTFMALDESAVTRT